MIAPIPSPPLDPAPPQIPTNRHPRAAATSFAPSPASAEGHLQLVVGRLLQVVGGFKGGFGRIGKRFWGRVNRGRRSWLVPDRRSLRVGEVAGSSALGPSA